MKFLKMAQNADFLLFLLGIFWMDISKYIQKIISICDYRVFSFISAVIIYKIVKEMFH